MVYLVCIFAYLLLIAGIGAVKSRQVTTQDDFAVAGRSLSPWVMVCTMLAVWIGTGSIVGNAEETYRVGMAALILPCGTLIGMILLSLVARRARDIQARSVPEIIGRRFGSTARALAVFALVIAYMVIVSYQFNAGGAVLEVIAGNRPPLALQIGDQVSQQQLRKGRLVYAPPRQWSGRAEIGLGAKRDRRVAGQPTGDLRYEVWVVGPADLETTTNRKEQATNTSVVQVDQSGRLRFHVNPRDSNRYVIQSLPEFGTVALSEPILTARVATAIAAVFIVTYAASAGLLTLAYADVITGCVITVSLVVAFPLYWMKAGGWAGMEASFAAMGDRPYHMQFWGVYSTTQLINFCLPVMLLVLGDANQYQRIFASRSAGGAESAVTTMIVVAFAIELLIIASAWAASSLTPDPENGKYILIYAARHYLPLPLGCLFMVTVVGIIFSTADSFLLIPATTVIQDVYLTHIRPQTSERRVVWLSRWLVVVFGLVAYVVSLAFAESTGFFQKALFAYTIYGASITPSLVAAITWKRATKAGAITSISAGTAASLLWGELDWLGDSLPPAIASLDAVLPAITVSVLCLVVVSLLTGRKEEG